MVRKLSGYAVSFHINCMKHLHNAPRFVGYISIQLAFHPVGNSAFLINETGSKNKRLLIEIESEYNKYITNSFSMNSPSKYTEPTS